MFKYQGLGTYKRSATGRFDSVTSFVRRVVKMIVRWSAISIAAYGVFVLGGLLNSTQTIKAETTVVIAPAPVLDRIADCESGNGKPGTATHYAKNGQVLMRPNSNGSVDVGKYQVNSVWFAKATSLGLDLTKEADNKTMAEWIYANKGTGDWSASAKCWSR